MTIMYAFVCKSGTSTDAGACGFCLGRRVTAERLEREVRASQCLIDLDPVDFTGLVDVTGNTAVHCIGCGINGDGEMDDEEVIV